MNNFNERFNELMQEPFMQLPQNWDGEHFPTYMTHLFDKYILKLRSIEGVNIDKVSKICKYLNNALDLYYRGKPAQAYNTLASIMNLLVNDNKFVFYDKASYGYYEDPLKLYRVRKVKEDRIYEKQEIFHTPMQSRNEISAFRYSIAGYPCLYLGTSVNLCLSETGIESSKALVARFKLVRDARIIHIKVLDLAIKPSDFVEYNENSVDINRKKFIGINYYDKNVKLDYLYLFPLIAACSIIANNREDKFVPEYIIPQLVLQWVRNSIKQKDKLFAVRYFSCREIGRIENEYNYVFPIETNYRTGYCDVLKKAFTLSAPVLIKNYTSTIECERVLSSLTRDEMSKIV